MSGFSDKASRVLALVQEAIAEPTANLTVALLLLAALVLSVLIVAGIIAFFALPTPYRRRKEDVLEAEVMEALSEGRASRGSRLTYAVVLILVASALGLGYAGTSGDHYCRSCHQLTDRNRLGEADRTEGAATAAAPPAAHSDVRCVSCHEEPVPGGLVANTFTRARHVVRGLLGADPAEAVALPPSSGCVRCHRREIAGTIESTQTGVRMSHAEPLAAGAVCVDCHADAGHRPDARTVLMNACLRCHDDRVASAGCSTCHRKDVALASRNRRIFPFVHLPPVTDCGGCHGQEVCDACHGLRMPHPQDFVDGEHARHAGFEKKNLCWRCHELNDCGKCHQTKAPGIGAWGHGLGDWWRREHGRNTPKGATPGCGCHGRSKYARAGNYCKACH